MRFLRFSFLIILLCYLVYCSTENKLPLEGVWKFESREFAPGTNIPNLNEEFTQAYKFISKTRWALVTQDTSQDLFWAKSGTYLVEGNKYTENIEVASFKKQLGKSFTFQFELKGDEWIISNKLGREVWKRVE